MLRRIKHWFKHEWADWRQWEVHQERRCKICGFTEKRQFPHVHQWGKWSVFGEIHKKGLSTGPRIVGEVQVRTCETCGLRDSRTTVMCG